jgi:HK97 gp10 family phage protein
VTKRGKADVKIEGLAEIAATLRALPRAVRADVMQGVLLSRAVPLQQAAAGMAPVLTGTLQNSIIISAKPPTNRTPKQHRQDREVFVKATSPNAIWQEFGVPHAPPQPFMRPAWDAEKGKLLDNIAADFWAAIEEAVEAHRK